MRLIDLDMREFLSVTLHKWKKCACIGLLVLLGIVALQCARMGLAGLNVELGRQEVDRWTSSRKPQGIQEVSRTASYFETSLRFVSDNPWALEGLGALNLAQRRLSSVPRTAMKLTQDAHQRFVQALRQRPTSPYLWANLALSKLYLDEIDAQFFQALRNANELGPWEPYSQQTFLFAGLAAWDKLDTDLRRAIVGALERGATRNAEKLYRIVKSYRRFDLVCAIGGYNAYSKSDCRTLNAGVKAEQPATKGKR